MQKVFLKCNTINKMRDENSVKNSKGQGIAGSSGGKRGNCWYVATMLLGVRPRSVAEMRKRLLAKRFSVEEVEKTISKCLEFKYLDDKQFAKIVCDSMILRKNSGKKAIVNKMRNFQLAGDLITQTINEYLPPEKELELAKETVGKKREQLKKRGVSEKLWYRRIGQYLMGRGFSGDVVREALEDIEG